MENEEYKWDDTLALGVDEIDNQHKLVIRSANKLNEALNAGHGKAVVENCMKEYMQFVNVHFTFEEEYFKKYDYIKMKEHIQGHDNFKKTFFEIIELVKKDGFSELTSNPTTGTIITCGFLFFSTKTLSPFA